MGEAKMKLVREGQLLKFDLCAPHLLIGKADRKRLATELVEGEELACDEKVVPRAVRFTITSLIGAAFPQGMARQDRKVWAAWQDALDDDPDEVEVTRKQLEWLKKHATDDNVKVQPGLAQWVEALADYVEALLDKPVIVGNAPPNAGSQFDSAEIGDDSRIKSG